MDHKMFWTGAEVLVWGGRAGTTPGPDGTGLYDPGSDSWRSITLDQAPTGRVSEAVVWTGSALIVWGGATPGEPVGELAVMHDTGALYDPATDTWRPMSTGGAPAPRMDPVAVWTGEELIVLWGAAIAEDGYRCLDDGARYNPSADTWAPLPTDGAPQARVVPAAVWTGTRVVIWGGLTCGDPWCNRYELRDYLGTGGLYDPATDIWSLMSDDDAPSGRIAWNVFWTGTEVIVWGGARADLDEDGAGGKWVPFRDGARYDPAADRWNPMSCTEAPEGVGLGVWTGTSMVMWGGVSSVADEAFVNSGGSYSPAEDRWTSLSLVGAPPAGGGHAAAWTGREAIFWGGASGDWNDQALVSTGARYVP